MILYKRVLYNAAEVNTEVCSTSGENGNECTVRTGMIAVVRLELFLPIREPAAWVKAWKLRTGGPEK